MCLCENLKVVVYSIMSTAYGIITHQTNRPTDYLYRLSLKALITNTNGDILVVKETGRHYYDLPGGGMDHGEDFRQALARELAEEVSLSGKFSYQIIDIDQPAYLAEHNFWQVRLIFSVSQPGGHYAPGIDGDEIAWLPLNYFEQSKHEVERRIVRYWHAAFKKQVVVQRHN